MKKKWIITIGLLGLVSYLFLPFPTIEYVDEIPRSISLATEIGKNDVIIGTYNRNTNTIRIVNGYENESVLSHELIHWQIWKLHLPYKTHAWLDRNY